MSEKKKFVEELPAEIPLDAPLSQLLQVVTHDKYRVISLATRWAQEIKQRDQATTLPPQVVFDRSPEMSPGWPPCPTRPIRPRP